MTSYHLKLIASLTMLLDHIGFMFYPEVEWLRIVGRVSFPLFVWLLVQGEAHTRNIWHYGMRLGGLALVSQPFYSAAFGLGQLNVLVSLLAGLICLRSLRRAQWVIPVFTACVLAVEMLPLGYGSYGIGLVVLTRYFRPNGLGWFSWISYHLVWAVLGWTNQLPVILVPLLFMAFNGERGPVARWFYVFYPGHLLLLALVSRFVLN